MENMSNHKNIYGENKEESIMTLYMNSLEMTIENDLTEILNEKEYYFSIIQDDEANIILIKLKLNKDTKLNPFNSCIYFYIKIDEHFPESAPYISCKSNFLYPTLFDNRDLTRSILGHKWKTNYKIIDLISSIPEFIQKYSNNIKNRILCEVGDFSLDINYDINDFLCNLELTLFKVQVEFCSSQSNSEITLTIEQKYIILTDIYILIFSPDSIRKNTGKLIFVGEIRDITSIKGTKVFNTRDVAEDNQCKSTGLIIEWSSSQDIYRFNNVIIIDSDKTNSFIDAINTRIKKLKEKFSVYQCEFTRIKDNKKKSEYEIKNLTNLIEYREKLYNESEGKDEINLKELMVLYQNLIEILSAQNDDKCAIYMNKLQKLFKNSNKTQTSDDDFFLLA